MEQEESAHRQYVLGIEFGTSNFTACAINVNTKVVCESSFEMIKEVSGGIQGTEVRWDCKIPSAIYFDQDFNEYIGEEAIIMSAAKEDTSRFVCAPKYLIGRKVHERGLDLLGDFKLLQDKQGTALVKIDRNNVFYPEEIIAKIFLRIKQMAVHSLGGEIVGTVLTVPADFSSEQIMRTSRAASIAGLNICNLVKEPIAALLAHQDEIQDLHAHICVFDFGGKTLDISVIEKKESHFAVMGTYGSIHLGGEDIDKVVCDLIVDSSLWPTLSVRQKYLIRKEAKRAKVDLSQGCDAQVSVPGFEKIIRYEDFLSSLNAAHIIERCQKVMRRALKRPQCDITHLLFVGGSSHVKPVRQAIMKLVPHTTQVLFCHGGGKALYATAQGAARLCLRQASSFLSRTPVSEEVTYLNLGILSEEQGVKYLTAIISKGKSVGTKRFQTNSAGQSKVELSVYEWSGEPQIPFSKSKNHTLLDTFIISLPDSSTEERQEVEVTFSTLTGSLEVNASVKGCTVQVCSKISRKKSNEIPDRIVSWNQYTVSKRQCWHYFEQLRGIIPALQEKDQPWQITDDVCQLIKSVGQESTAETTKYLCRGLLSSLEMHAGFREPNNPPENPYTLARLSETEPDE
eukprot:GILI01034365.1.p1 GENE.GILI01034365.1~~GILI01034365.1.p1  ORF type:complete len:667 (-),score=44.23 GILI01034365.1:93-1970(-)